MSPLVQLRNEVKSSTKYKNYKAAMRPLRKNPTLTLKRKKWILEFRQNWITRRKVIFDSRAGNFLKSPRWPVDLHAHLQSKDNEIRLEDVKRWIKCHSWITEPSEMPKGLETKGIRKNQSCINKQATAGDMRPRESLESRVLLSPSSNNNGTNVCLTKSTAGNQQPDSTMPVLTPHNSPVGNTPVTVCRPGNMSNRSHDDNNQIEQNDEDSQSEINLKKRWRQSYIVNTVDNARGGNTEPGQSDPCGKESCQSVFGSTMQQEQPAHASGQHAGPTPNDELPHNMPTGTVQGFLPNNITTCASTFTTVQMSISNTRTVLTAPGYDGQGEQLLYNYPQGNSGEATCNVETENEEQVYGGATSWNNVSTNSHHYNGMGPGGAVFGYDKQNTSAQTPPIPPSSRPHNQSMGPTATATSSLHEIRELIQRTKTNGFRGRNPWGDTPTLCNVGPPDASFQVKFLLSAMEKMCRDFGDTLLDVPIMIKHIQKCKRVFSRIMNKVLFPVSYKDAIKNRVEECRKIKREHVVVSNPHYDRADHGDFMNMNGTDMGESSMDEEDSFREERQVANSCQR